MYTLRNLSQLDAAIFTPDGGIIYCLTRADAERVVWELNAIDTAIDAARASDARKLRHFEAMERACRSLIASHYGTDPSPGHAYCDAVNGARTALAAYDADKGDPEDADPVAFVELLQSELAYLKSQLRKAQEEYEGA